MKRLIQRFLVWRYEHELRRKYPDPFIVCGHARGCPHVDGLLCKPITCSDCIKPSRLTEVKVSV
jgi:hypothetical protein